MYNVQCTCTLYFIAINVWVTQIGTEQEFTDLILQLTGMYLL